MEYELIRSRRKTLCAEIRDGRLIVRAPLRVSRAEISRFLTEKRPWIEKHLAQAREAERNAAERLTQEEIRALTEEARRVIPARVAFYARKVGVDYGRITIRHQRTRWGSCSAKGNLNFNCLLMLTPYEVIDSVIVHELCHRKEMNHSALFYAEVVRVFPEYRKWQLWLKRHGQEILARMGQVGGGLS